MIAEIFKQLNNNQILFVYEYLKDFNATQAAIRAGYSPHSAAQQGAELCKHPNIRVAIDYMILERANRVKIDADWVLNEYIKLYNGVNLDDFIKVNEQGKPRYDFSTATREQMNSLESLSIKPGEFGTSYKLSMASKKDLLAQIGKHVSVQAWRDQINLTGEVSVSFDKEDADA